MGSSRDKELNRNYENLDAGSAARLKEMVAVLNRHDLLHGITPEKVRLILEDLGPTFVKLGQVMSMRHDFLPKEYCDELIKLRSEVKPLPFGVIKDVIQQEYSRSWDSVFETIDEEVLGSASIAQVHKAQLKDGRWVVIKVQRPGIYQLMGQDIVLLKRAMALLNLVHDTQGVVNFNNIINEMWEMAKQEMDFLREADNIEEFRHLNSQVEDGPVVECPWVIRQLTTQRILVMEYVDGVALDDTAGLAAANIDLEQIGTELGTNYVKQIIEDGFFHADPHPGNIWIRNGRIVWLDLGMMGRLSPVDRSNIRRAIMALVNHDAYEMKAAVLALGDVRGRVDHAVLYEDISSLMDRYGELNFESLNLGKLVREILNIFKANSIGVPPGFGMFARGVLIIEGVMKKCCPMVSFSQIFARSLELDFKKNFSFAKELYRVQREGHSFMHKTLQLPEQLSDILKMTLSGQTKVNLDLTGSDEPLSRIDSMINKMVMAIISAALLLGSSTICTTEMTPKIMEIPLLGVFGYLAALILCSRLVWSIYKADKRDRRK